MRPSTLFVFTAGALATDFQSYSETALTVLQQWYDTDTGLWDTTGWWNGANCMTVIADLAAADSSVLATATSVFANTFTAAPASNPNGNVVKASGAGRLPETTYNSPAAAALSTRTDEGSGFEDSYYDDNGWWALAWIAAYDLTQNDDYLDTAVTIFNQMEGGGPTNCSNGGIVWSQGDYYVNAIANELFLSVAAHLANRMSNGSDYWTIATSQLTWFQNSGMIVDDLINDGLNPDCTNNGGQIWSYNQGVILGALVEMNKYSSDSSYLSTAATLAAASIANLTDSNHIVHEWGCEPNCGGDGSQFKGVYMRNLQALHQAAPQDAYVEVFNASALSIWNNDRNEDNQFSVEWAGPFVSTANASTHSSAMDALIAALVAV